MNTTLPAPAEEPVALPRPPRVPVIRESMIPLCKCYTYEPHRAAETARPVRRLERK